jgi:hypothetical protein
VKQEGGCINVFVNFHSQTSGIVIVEETVANAAFSSICGTGDRICFFLDTLWLVLIYK